MGKNGHKHSVVVSVCDGSSCREHKSKKVAKHIKTFIKENDLGDRVCIHKCDCMKRCKHGPIVRVQPGGERFETVKSKDIAVILDAILDEIPQCLCG